MKKILSMLAVMVLASATTPGFAGALTITYNYALGDGGKTSPYSWAQVETFDTTTPLWNWTGNYIIRTGSTSGQAAAPYGVGAVDTTKYISVPQTGGNGSAIATQTTALLDGTFRYLGLWWGSVDTYNSITFFNNNIQGLTITGAMAISPSYANGNQTGSKTNLYVNFFVPEFDSFRLTSTQYAFEVDNIAVPEPGTMLLLGSGLLGLVALNRRRKA